jgi:hypothetical protein
LCISAAKELAMLLQWVHQMHREAIPEPWFVIFYMYTCGMALLLDRHGRISEHGCLTSWNACIETLRFYETTHKTAFRCVRLLELSDRSLFVTTASQTRPQTSECESSRCEGSERTRAAGANEIDRDLPVSTTDQGLVLDQPFETEQQLPSYVLDDQFDFAWLGTVPFDLNFDEGIGGPW